MDDKKKKKAVRLLVAAILLVLGGLIFYLISNIGIVDTDDAYIDGRIHSIAAKIPGTVKELYVDDNQAVKKGEVLLQIDPADYAVKLKEAEASLEAEKARAQDAESGIANAEVSLKQAALDKARAEALFAQKVIPKERHEKAMTAYDLAAVQLKAAGERHSLEQSLVKQKEAGLEAARLNLGYTLVSAPADGYITKRSVETGNQIQANQPLMAVVALDDIWITANFKETQLKNVRPGQAVKIKVDTYPGKVFSGRVDSIMAGTGAVFSLFPPENALGNYVKVVQRIPVKIAFDKGTDEGHVLRIGMSCIPKIYTRNGKSK